MDFDDDDDGLFETVDLVEEEGEPLPKPGPSSGGTEGSLTFKAWDCLEQPWTLEKFLKQTLERRRVSLK